MAFDTQAYIQVLYEMITTVLVHLKQSQRPYVRFGPFQNVFEYTIVFCLHIQKVYRMVCFL